ncbi:hypothetical protein GCM10023208_34200 [Erythrobacter westpacificensis]|uniref:Xylose isomerase-like TIM barrel domain-containing protein n=1 Tax=Erythrobacter westpacificensis TaxID=1055231 RepID=A0ABP9KTB8_9SPHN
MAKGPSLEAQIEFAVEQGFAGILSPWISSQGDGAVRAFGALLKANHLEAGCVVYTSMEQVMQPLWVSDASADRESLFKQIESAADTASEIGSHVVAILAVGEPDGDREEQLANFSENLSRAADVAAERGIVLGVEPMLALPDVLFRSAMGVADALRSVNHPSARMIFDTGHIAQMERDLLGAQELFRDLVCLYQLADEPGRTEPGSGTLEFAPFLARLMDEGYDGLVELEHGWSREDPAIEETGLNLLRQLDSRAFDDGNAKVAGK